MQLTAEATVMGFKSFTGNIDGNQIDSGTLFVELKLKGKDSKGTATEAYKTTNSESIKRIFHLEPPFLAALTMEEETNGKGSVTKVVTDVRPIKAKSSADAFIEQATKPVQGSAPAPAAAPAKV